MNTSVNMTNPFGGFPLTGNNRHDLSAAIEAAGLNFEVEKQPVFLKDGSQVKNSAAVVRTDTNNILGVVGSRYHPIQNANAFSVFQKAFDDGLLEAEICGTIDSGRIVWMQAKVVGESMRVVGDDLVHPYVLLANGHDGSLAIKAGFTAIRLFCMNRMAAARREGCLVSLRHTKNLDLTVLRDGIASGQQDLQSIIGAAQALSMRKVKGTKQLNEFTRNVFDINDSDVIETDGDDLTKVTRTERRIAELFESGVGSEYKPVRGSWWNAYNAVTEFLTHHRGRSGENRAKSVWFGSGAKTVRRALDTALEMAA